VSLATSFGSCGPPTPPPVALRVHASLRILAVEVEDLNFAYVLYAGDPSNGSSTTRVASFREGRIGYREWATPCGRINPSLEDRLDHDVEELMA
jgi:hypothetical protein